MSLKSEPLVSCVTPVYNAEKYLPECIESVLGQRYENWEYVIVNNCSSDGSLAVAENYARKDDRVRVHNNAHFLTQMQNWNHSLRQISPNSKYCKVVHADDWLFPECISRMIELAEANPSVGIVGSYRLDEKTVNLDGLPFPSTVVSGREICRKSLLGGPYLFGSPTSLLIRSDLILEREKFYNEENIHADKEVCYDLLQHTDFGFVHQVLTFTRRHNEATTTFIRRFQTIPIGTFIVLKKYGHAYLNEKEYKECHDREMRVYYRMLAQSSFEMREKEFWKYHKTALKQLGYSLNIARIIKSMFFELKHPRDVFRRIKSVLQRSE
jgi:glycosyltransferase involved in cell wall biosynthesis